MSMTAQQVLDDAHALAYPHILESAISPAQLLRQLTALEHEIVTYLALHAPGLVSVEGTPITTTPANNAAGYALQSALVYTDFQYEHEGFGGVEPILIVPEARFDHPSRHPAARLRGQTFVPADPLGLRWSTSSSRAWYGGNGERVLYRYVAAPPVVSSPTQVLVAPDFARPYFAHALSLTMLLAAQSHSPSVPQERFQTVAGLLERARLDLMLTAVRQAPPAPFRAAAGVVAVPQA